MRRENGFPTYASIVPLCFLTFLTDTYTTLLRNNASSLLQVCGYFCLSDKGNAYIVCF